MEIQEPIAARVSINVLPWWPAVIPHLLPPTSIAQS